MSRAPLSSTGPTHVHRDGTTWVDVWTISIIPMMLVLDLAAYFADLKLGTSPSVLLVGYGLGLCVVLYAVITTQQARGDESAVPMKRRLGG